MRKIFFLSFLLIALNAFSQDSSGQKHSGIRHQKFAPLNADSMVQRMKDSFAKNMQDMQNENNIRNLQEVMRSVDAQKKKEKSKAVVYIVIGVGMLFVLFFGLMRRRAEKKV